MKIEDIANKISEENQEEILKDLFSEKKVYTFLVGAGISMDPPSNLPSARMFVKGLFKYYAPEEEIEKLSSLDSLRYEFLVEKTQNLFDKDIKFLDYLDHVKEPNAIHLFLANMIMRYNYVITTNFDYLLEMAMQKKLSIYPMYNYFHEKFMVIITKEDYEKNVINQFPVIKIHGSKWDCIKGRLTKDSLITTISTLGKEKEKGKTFAIEAYKRKLINTVMQDRDLVIMGYSGGDDFDISPMLKELNTIKRIIWIDHNPDAISGDQEIYHYKPVQDISELNSNFEINKLDKLLIELSSLNNNDVYKIKTKTLNFVKNKLAPIYKESFEFLKIDTTKDFLSFNEYMKDNHFNASQSSKYRLAHEIYYDLGEIESAERTALKGLTLSKEAEEDVNQTYFINALGLIHLSKGEYDKAIANFEHTLELTEKLNQMNEKIGVLLNLGEVYRKKSDLKNSFKYISEASNIMTNYTPAILKFSILNNLGALYRDNGDIDNAVRNIELAFEITERTGDLFSKALCYNNLAGIQISQGLLNPALKNSSEALKINEQLGDLDDMCSTLNTIGNIFTIAGQYSQALQYLGRAYQTADKIQNLNIKALAANSIGVIHYESGKKDLAMKYYNEALMIRKKIGDLSGQATTLNNIGIVYRTNRDYNTAFELINQSIELTEKIGEKKNLAVRYGNRASIYEIRREFEKALEEYKKALQIEQSQNNLAGIASQLTNIGGILGDLGRYEETIKHYTDALNIMENLGIKPGIARSLNNLGMIFYKYKKDYHKSIDYLKRALEIYKELNLPNMIMTTQQNLDFIKREFESN
ncbi:MAG TPA: tetratricopeptide repeat protein [Candidatus Nanopelagicaceae bacterium]|nr:tetratricopeptide repeat protein [Candidatus Nanopelagicaceae bacterium]